MLSGLSGFATDPKTVTLTSSFDQTTVAPGGTITQTIAVSNLSSTVVGGIRAFAIEVAYDSTNFTAHVYAKIGSVVEGYKTISGSRQDDLSVNYSTNKARIVFASSSPSTGLTPITGGGILVITYTANSAVNSYSIGAITAPDAISFIDCASPASDATLTEVGGRTVAPTTLPSATTVKVEIPKSSAKAITSFTLAGVAGTITGTTIDVTVPYGTDLSSIAATVVISASATVSPASGAAIDLSSKTATYTVTAEDLSTQPYTVNVTVAAPTDPIPGLSSFVLTESKTVDDAYTANNVISNVAEGTDVPTFITTLAPVSESVTFVFTYIDGTVMAQDGSDGLFVGTGTTIDVLVNGVPYQSYIVQIFGDINGDGYADGSDLLMYVGWYVYNDTFVDAQELGADINGDGYADGSDLLVYVHWYVYNAIIYQDDPTLNG